MNTKHWLPSANEVAGRKCFEACLSVHRRVPCGHYPWCIGTHHTGSPLPLQPQFHSHSPPPHSDMRPHRTGILPPSHQTWHNCNCTRETISGHTHFCPLRSCIGLYFLSLRTLSDVIKSPMCATVFVMLVNSRNGHRYWYLLQGSMLSCTTSDEGTLLIPIQDKVILSNRLRANSQLPTQYSTDCKH